MGQVAEKLQAVARIDPAAHARLIGQLAESRPELWPLIVDQFHAALSYRQELNPSRPHGPAEVAPRQPIRAASDYQEPEGASMKIGRLVDPRRIRRDMRSDEELASSSPAVATGPEAVPVELDPVLWGESSNQATSQVTTSADSVPNSTNEQPVNNRVQLAAFNEPVSAPDPDVDELLQLTLAAFARDLPAEPQDSDEVLRHARLRMLHLVAGDDEAAVRPIPGVPPAEQDFWSKQLFALATYTDVESLPDERRRAAAAAMYLEEALGKLREQGTLAVRNLAFCTKVLDYGAYESYGDNHFSKGQQVTLYTEVENFSSRQGPEGFYTSLGSSYVVVDDEGTRVDGGQFPDVRDTCRRRRRDFHIQYGLTLPSEAVPGRYQLQLMIKDNQSDKIGRNTIDFEIKE
jgi:hypothetical protein